MAERYTPHTPRLLTALFVTGAALAAATPMEAQRALRVGAVGSVFRTETGGDRTSTGYGLQFGYLSSANNETALTVTNWPGAHFGGVNDGALALALENNWYPVDATGIAPYVISGLGAYRFTTQASLLTPQRTEWGISYLAGFGLRAGLSPALSAALEGRLRSDDGSRNIEYRAGVSYGFGANRVTKTAPGTAAPFAAYVGRLNNGPYRARTPLAGIRFRRDRTPHSSLAVDIGVVGLEPEPNAITGEAARTTGYVMMPSYEIALAPDWGRPYLSLGPNLVGFLDGPDAGLRAGIHAGGGVDVYAGQSVEVNLLTRATWFQSASSRHQFGWLIGVGIGPRLGPGRGELARRAKEEAEAKAVKAAAEAEAGKTTEQKP